MFARLSSRLQGMEAPQWFFSKALSHKQKVLRLYKRALRQVDYWFLPEIGEWRYHKVLLRARFDSHRDEKDMRIAKQLLIDGVRELWDKQHPTPFHHQYEAQGNAKDRPPVHPDHVLDQWHPREKALYPQYFAHREARRKEFDGAWEKIIDEKEKQLPK